MIEELQNTTATPVAVVRLDNIWSYEHFADALLDYFNLLKRRNPRFTLNAWAKKLGEKNSGNLVHYFKKRRSPTAEMTEKLVRTMHLAPDEADYFRLLVNRARRQNANGEKEFKNRIDAHRLQHHGRVLDLSKFETVSSPLHFAVREILFLQDADTSLAGVQAKLRVPVPLEEIQRAIDELVQVGLISRNALGGYSRSEDFWQTPGEFPSDAIRLYHLRSLKDYSSALQEVPVDQRHFTSFMFGINHEMIPEAKKAIEEFMNSFVARFGKHGGAGNQVYQIHTLFSPWSKK